MSELQEVEITIQDCKEAIERKAALDRLRMNKDWKEIVEEGFLKDEAQRVVWALAEPALQEEKDQKMLLSIVNSVGYFRQYLNKVYQMSNQAEKDLAAHEETRIELMSE
jgi:hypothetical protein